jgi:hypothetical protein
MTIFEAKINKHIVIPFITGDYNSVQYINSFYCEDNKILINNEACFTKTNKGIIIEGLQQNDLLIQILKLLPDVWGVEVKNGSIFINGIEWDGSKCNINLFK